MHFQEHKSEQRNLKQQMVSIPFNKFVLFLIFIFSDMKIIVLKEIPIFFLYSLKYFGDSWEVYGSRFWQKKSKFQKSFKKYCNRSGDLK